MTNLITLFLLAASIALAVVCVLAAPDYPAYAMGQGCGSVCGLAAFYVMRRPETFC